MRNMRRRIYEIYQAHPQAGRLDVLRALALEKPSALFDDQLVKVQSQLRKERGLPPLVQTKGPLTVEKYPVNGEVVPTGSYPHDGLWPVREEEASL